MQWQVYIYLDSSSLESIIIKIQTRVNLQYIPFFVSSRSKCFYNNIEILVFLAFSLCSTNCILICNNCYCNVCVCVCVCMRIDVTLRTRLCVFICVSVCRNVAYRHISRCHDVTLIHMFNSITLISRKVKYLENKLFVFPYNILLSLAKSNISRIILYHSN